jgi:hypothetical protein
MAIKFCPRHPKKAEELMAIQKQQGRSRFTDEKALAVRFLPWLQGWSCRSIGAPRIPPIASGRMKALALISARQRPLLLRDYLDGRPRT